MFKNSNFSIFGDLAQRIYSYRTIDSWGNVKKHIFDEQCENLKLISEMIVNAIIEKGMVNKCHVKNNK